MATADQILLDACRILGRDRTLRAVSSQELAVRGEYHLRAMQEAEADGAEQLVAYHAGALDSIKAETDRRIHRARYEAPTGLTADAIRRIKEAVPCPEAFESQGIHLRKASGSRWLTHCTNHVDRTPSLSVWPDHFYCFACHWSGDVFTLIESLKDCTFMEACRLLADYAGLPDLTVLPPQPPAIRGVQF